ncbi:MFS transporter, partial [Pseudomonas aeruginosa]
FSDLTGRKRPIVFAPLLSMVATLLMALWPRREPRVVARLLIVAGTALASVTVTAFIIELIAGVYSRTSAN